MTRCLSASVMLVLCFLVLTGEASAGTQRTWTGGGGTAAWSNAANWSPSGAPVAGDGVTFTTPTSSVDDVAAAVANILFTSTAGGSTIGGTVNIDAAQATINIKSSSDGNQITGAIVNNSGSNLFIQSATAGQRLTLSGVISGNAGIRVYGPGSVEFAQASNNTYTGSTTVASNDTNGSAGTLELFSTSAGSLVPGDLQIGGTVAGQPANSARVKLLFRDVIAGTGNVTIASDGLLDLNGVNETVNSVAVAGHVTQGAGNLSLTSTLALTGGSIEATTGALVLSSSVAGVTASGSSAITAPIRLSALSAFALPVTVSGGAVLSLGPITPSVSPTVGVTKAGTGELQINGENTYTGATTVTAGTLTVNPGGSLSSSALGVSGGGTLRGLGTSGVVSVAGGHFAPGTSVAPGTYAITGGLALTASSTFDVDVTNAGVGAASATGSIALGNSTLHINIAPGYVAPAHAKLRIIDNLGSGPVGGTFAGLPEGTSVLVGTQLFKLTYAGGTGNDVELTLPNTAPILAAGATAAPSPGVAGTPVTFSAAAADADQDALSYTWSFGDGTTGTGATTTHTYSAAGQYAVSVAIGDGFGGALSSATSVTVNPAPPAGPSGPGSTAAPALTDFAQTHATWRAGKALAVFAKAAKRAPVGTRLSFTLDQPATVALAFTQSVTGRKSGARCVAQTPRNHKAKSCKRTLTLGTIKHAGRAGKNTVSFQARLSNTKKLKPGHYRVTATAVNAAGKASKPSTLSFTIVK